MKKQTILLPLCYFAVIKFYFRWYLNAVYYQLTELFPKGNLFEPCSLLKFKKKKKNIVPVQSLLLNYGPVWWAMTSCCLVNKYQPFIVVVR